MNNEKQSQPIEEGNKLIAEFMGAKHVVDGNVMWNKYNQFPDMMYTCKPSQLKYLSSWDWLMPVVEKIADINYMNFNLSSFEGAVFYDDNYKNTASGKRMFSKTDKLIDSTWQAVILFIQWYNTTKK